MDGSGDVSPMIPVTMTVNGQVVTAQAEPRTLLVDFLRDRLKLTGTHVGCDTSQCGACIVHVDGKSVKSCAMLVAQADGCEVLTIEGVHRDGALHPVQQAFHEHHALQCGFCTPGMVMSVIELLERNRDPSEDDIRLWLEGNLCRCTGYRNIIGAVRAAADTIRGAGDLEDASAPRDRSRQSPSRRRP
jgi:aerobic carbon-monoxide dehydrogenase small subunit